MKEYKTRLEHLESLIGQIRHDIEANKQHFELNPVSFYENRFILAYFQPCQKVEAWKIEGTLYEVLQKAKEAKNTDVFVNMIFCREWAHLFFQNSELYNQEQKERLKKEELEKDHSLQWLYEDAESSAILANMKQNNVFNTEILERGTHEESF